MVHAMRSSYILQILQLFTKCSSVTIPLNPHFLLALKKKRRKTISSFLFHSPNENCSLSIKIEKQSPTEWVTIIVSSVLFHSRAGVADHTGRTASEDRQLGYHLYLFASWLPRKWCAGNRVARPGPHTGRSDSWKVRVLITRFNFCFYLCFSAKRHSSPSYIDTFCSFVCWNCHEWDENGKYCVLSGTRSHISCIPGQCANNYTT